MKRLTTLVIGRCCGFLFVITATLLMGTSVTPKQTERATLRIYCKTYNGYGSGFGIKINDQLVINHLKNKSWLEVEVPAGTLALETVPELSYPTYAGKAYSMQIEAGKLYNLEAVIDYEFLVSSMYLVLRDENEAIADMKRLNQETNALQKID